MKKALIITALALGFGAAAGGLGYVVTNNYNQANIKNLNSQIEQLNTKNDDIVKLTSKINSLTSQKNELVSKNQELTAEVSHLQELCNEADGKNNDLVSKIESLNSQISANEDQISQLKTDIAEMEEKINSLNSAAITQDFLVQNNLAIVEFTNYRANGEFVETSTNLMSQSVFEETISKSYYDYWNNLEGKDEYLNYAKYSLTGKLDDCIEPENIQFTPGYIHVCRWIEHGNFIFFMNGSETFHKKLVKTAEDIANIPSPTREGYEFIGWSIYDPSSTAADTLSNNLNGVEIVDTTMENTLVNLYAVFKNDDGILCGETY